MDTEDEDENIEEQTMTNRDKRRHRGNMPSTSCFRPRTRTPSPKRVSKKRSQIPQKGPHNKNSTKQNFSQRRQLNVFQSYPKQQKKTPKEKNTKKTTGKLCIIY